MKRLIALLLTLVMVFALCACGGDGAGAADEKEQSAEVAEEPSREEVIEEMPEPTTEPVWATQQTVDEFGDVTEDSETVVRAAVSGDFSNTATSSSELTGVVFLGIGGQGFQYNFRQIAGTMYHQTIEEDHPIFTFRLFEYGSTQATYTNFDPITFKTKIDDTISNYDQVLSNPPNGDIIVIDVEEVLYNALYNGNDVRCIINIGSSQYNFTLYADGFTAAVKEANLITDSVYYAETSADDLYNEAKDFIEKGEYTKAVENLAHIKNYKDSTNLMAEALCLAHFIPETKDLWKDYFDSSEYTALTGDEIQKIIVGDWYQDADKYSTYSDNGEYSFTNTEASYANTGGTWSIDGDFLVVHEVTSYGNEYEWRENIYPFYRNAYIFGYTKEDGGFHCYIQTYNGVLE